MLRDETIGEATWCGTGDEHAERCDKLHRTLKRIVKARGALDAQEAKALREAKRLVLWRRYGCASLLEYLEREMGYSPRAAMERLRVAEVIVELPQIAEALAQGEMSFSTAKEITRIATPETEAEWICETKDKNQREIEGMVAGLKRGSRPKDPVDPKLKRTTLRFYDVRPELEALVRQARKVLESERGERLDDDALVEAAFRLVLEVRAAQREHAAYQIAVTVCERCKAGTQDGGGVTVEVSPPVVERALCDAQHIGSIDGDEVQRASQDIPPATRRKVLRRDHGRCQVPGCRSARNLDVHHIKPRSAGGTHEPSNLLTLCEGHHLAHHEGALRIEGTPPRMTFTRVKANNFTTVTRAVETASALKNLGFRKHEITEAMERTKSHVGTAELTIQQWIEIALRYCPKPRT